MPSILRLLIRNRFGPLLAVLFLFSGCAVRSVYIPVSQNCPLFGPEKELQAVAYVGANHIELQGALTPVKNLALIGNLNYGSGISIYEAAVGIYRYSANTRWRWEAFTGYGYNTNFAYQTANYNALTNTSVKDYEVQSLYHKYFLQSSFGYFGEMKMYKIKYSFSFSSRFSAEYFKVYSFKELDDQATQTSGAPVYIYNIAYHNSFMYLLEPCITNKVGIKNLSIVLQAQAFFPYSGQIDIRNTVFSPGIIFSAGIQYTMKLKSRGDVSKN